MLLQQIMNGLTVGSTYSLIAIGYTLIFGVLGIINMAHGQIFIFGSFVGLTFILKTNLPLPYAFVVAVIVSALAGLLLEFFALRPLRKKAVPHLASLISTIGFAVALDEITVLIFGADSQSVPDTGLPVIETSLLQIRTIDLLIIALSILIMLLLYVWIQKTKMGSALRATSENRETAGLLGIPTNSIIIITVMIASGLGGVAGMMIGSVYSALVPTMGLTLGFKGLVALILGGVGSIPGAMLSGILIGLAETFAVAYGDSSYKDAVSFLIVIAVFAIRPQGLFGKKIN